jgi:hypothetical protein
VYCAAANVAVTVVFCTRLNTQLVLVLPAQAPPDQLVNVAPVFGTAVSVIPVPATNVVPVGDCVMVPGPTTLVEIVYAGPNCAVVVTFDEILNEHTGFVLPLQGPRYQLPNALPALGTAVKVIGVFGANDVPAGDCVIVPSPLPLVFVERVYWFGLVNVAVIVVFVVRSA